ncbi:MAG: MlaA family lipoprotein [Candidatus Methylomirabilia bacterium]
MRAVNVAWRLGLLLALALVAPGCAHQTGARAPGGVSGAPAPAGVPDSGAARDAAPAVESQPSQALDTLATEDDFEEWDTPRVQVADPLGPWNRAMFQFNDKFYFWFLKPVSKAYRAVVPSLARNGVENFFNNLGAPRRFVSNALQFKGREASIELGKFMINSTWGVLGFGNLFAGKPEMKIPDTDLGLTLAHHGVGTGAYVVWPFLGPYTLRDTVGWVGGLTIDPITYVNPMTVSLGARTYSLVNYTSFRIGDYESLKDASIDPYLATRDAYLQYRAEKARE